MATRLYLRTDAPSAAIPRGPQSVALPAGSAFYVNSPNRSLRTTKSATAEYGYSYDTLGQVARQDIFIAKFVSPRLSVQDLAAGTWTGAIRVREGGNAANAFLAASIYLYTPPTGARRIIYDASTALGNEWASLGARGRAFSVAGLGMRVEQDDVLVLELWQTATQGDTNIYTQEAYIDGAGDDAVEGGAASDEAAWLEAPQDLTFVESETAYTPGTTGREYGKRAIGERWYHCATCGHVEMESNTTVPQVPFPQAGLRVCMRCYDPLGYEENSMLNPPPLEPPDVEVPS